LPGSWRRRELPLPRRPLLPRGSVPGRCPAGRASRKRHFRRQRCEGLDLVETPPSDAPGSPANRA